MTAESGVIAGSPDEVSRLLALLVRLQIGNQSSTILELDRLGLGPKRIGELLGTTANTVNVTIHKAKKREPSRGSKSVQAHE